MIPQFSTSYSKKLKTCVAILDGGINLSKLPSDIEDNQSPDMLNMWYRDGMLRTRPGLKRVDEGDECYDLELDDLHNLGVQHKLVAQIYHEFIDDERKIYIPTIFTNCNSRGAGNQYEDRNLLTPRVKMAFSPAGGDKTFKLADEDIDDADIKIHYSCPTTTFDDDYVIPKGSNYVEFTDPLGDTYRVTVDKTQGLITWAYVKGTKPYTPDKWPGFMDDATYNVMNNLVFEYAKTLDSTFVLENCTLAQWFGGSLSGLGNGSCLVVSGNHSEPNKYWWSAPDNIYYWPANNFNSCGDSSEAITALAKQGSYLVAFTKNKIYKIAYNSQIPANTTVPYEEFPRSLLHPTIGCDCPDTIQLVDNCLTWLNSDGHIYRLVNTSNRDENAVVSVSKNIEKKLKEFKKEDLQAASACDDGRCYYLSIGDTMLVWDYDLASFINYSDSDKAQDRLVWYIWKFYKEHQWPFYYNGKMYIVNRYTYHAGDVYREFYEPLTFDDDFTVDEEYDTVDVDTGHILPDIHSFDAYVKTKAFDFNLPSYYKQVYGEWFDIAADNNAQLKLQMIDDAGIADIGEISAQESENIVTYSYSQPSTLTRRVQLMVEKENDCRFGVDKIILNATIAGTM